MLTAPLEMQLNSKIPLNLLQLIKKVSAIKKIYNDFGKDKTKLDFERTMVGRD